MTIERKNEDRDRLVRDTYRALANERVPDRLNDRVLRGAAKVGRSRYALTRALTRPVAWAATIALSLAIVLEFTRLPQTVPDATSAAEPRNDVSMDQFAPRDMTVLRDAENMARVQAGANQAPIALHKTADTVRAEEDSPIASLTAVSEQKAVEPDYACPEEARETAESWFACIEQLRADGPAERAASEYEKFRRIFPDFVDFAADK